MEINSSADGGNLLRLSGKEAPDVTVVKGVRIVSSSAAQRVFNELNLEEGGVIADLTNAIWVFGPGDDFTLRLGSADTLAREPRQLKGTCSERGGIIEFHAENISSQRAATSIDGTIARGGSFFQMEGVYSACYSISPPIIARISQPLQEAPEPSSGDPPASIAALNEAPPTVPNPLEEIAALPGNEWMQEVLERYDSMEGVGDSLTPLFFDIILEGKTETAPFGPLAGTLIITPALPSDPDSISVTLGTEGSCSNGWLSWITEASFFTRREDQPARFKTSVVGNTIQIDLIPTPYAEPTTWYTVPKNARTADALTPVRIRSATLWLEITEKKFLKGKLQATGIYDWDYVFELPSDYEATISGRVQGSTEVGLTRAEAAHPGFGGKWLFDDPQFGEVELAVQANRVSGRFGSCGAGTVRGVVAGNLAEFTWPDDAGGEGWAFARLVAGGRLLAGMYGRGAERAGGSSIVAVRQSDSTLPDRAYAASDRKELRRLGIDLFLEGKLDTACRILEKALRLYADERDSGRNLFLDKEGDLIDEGSILNYLNICYYNLGDYEGLLKTLNREVDIERKLSPLEYFKSVFSQRADNLLKSIGRGRSILTDFRLRVLAMRAEVDSESPGDSTFSNELKAELFRKIDRLAELLAAARSQLGSAFNLIADARYRVETALASPRDELKSLASGLRDQRRALLDVLLATPKLLREGFPAEAELYEDAARFFLAFYPEAGRDAMSINLEELAAAEKQVYDRLRACTRLTPLEKSLFVEHLNAVRLSSLPLEFGLESDFIATMDVDSAWESQDRMMRSSALQLAETLENWRARLLTDLDKIEALDQAQPFFQKLTKFFVGIGNSQEALLVAEIGRARAFIDMMLSAPDQAHQDVVVSLTSAPSPSVEMIKRASFEHKATIVYYAIVQDGPEELYIWVVRPDGSITFRSISPNQIGRQKVTSIGGLINRARLDMGVTGRGAFEDDASQGARAPDQPELGASAEVVNTALQQLYRLLIAPISALLPNDPDELVIFIPQGPLFLVPFACLQESAGINLIDQHTILLATSIQLLDLIHQRSRRVRQDPGRRVLVMGNPVMPSVRMAPGHPAIQLRKLPWAEKEAKMVAEIMNTTALIGDEATRKAALQLMSESRIIHLATHALFEDMDGSGMPGAIAMAPSGGDGGLITTREILRLRLEADMVVLSACNTARGRPTGDGVIGLSRSILLAGASSIIVSLWAVDDEATAVFMGEFYRNYTSGLSKAGALRKATLRTRDLYQGPVKWAAFTLIGEAI